MALKQTRKKQLPDFRSREDEAEFWETHSPLDYEDDLEEVSVEFSHPLNHTLAVRLDAASISRLARIARSKGIGPSTLARMWLLERLDAEQSSETRRS
jgi:hypothetical protein